VALTATSALVLAGSASAASQTVQGSGDIDKMTVNNAEAALKVNLFGFGPPCDAHYMRVVVDWGCTPPAAAGRETVLRWSAP